MPLRSPKTRKKIESATRRFVNYLRYRSIGPHVLSKDELKELVRHGLIRPGRPPKNAVQRAYALTHAKMVDKELAPRATRDGAIDFLERMFDRYAKKTGEALATDLQNQIESQLMPFMDRSEGKAIYGLLKDPANQNKYLGNKLNDSVQNWAMRWKTIVNTELHRASNLGAHDAIIHNNKPDGRGPDEICVFKIGPNDGATCKHCRHFWFLPDGITPKVYRLSELSAGGTNIGRKAAQWEATVDSTHPNCFSGDMKLHTDSGIFTFRELFESNSCINVVSDVRIKSDYYERYRERGAFVTPATHVYETGVQELLLIETKAGPLKVTKDHEVWVHRRGNRPVKKKAGELKVGDKLLRISGEGGFGPDSWEKEAELIGNFYGDGFLAEGTKRDGTSSGHSIFWNFFGKEIDYGRILEGWVKGLGVFDSWLIGNKSNRPSLGFSTGGSLGQSKMEQIRFGSVPAFRFAVSKGFKEKSSVPLALWKSDKKTVAAFLRGLFSADGTVHKSKSSHGVALSTSSENLANEVINLLSMFGIAAKKYLTRGGRMVSFGDRESVCADNWRVFIGGTDVAVFATEINFGIEDKRQAVSEILRTIKRRSDSVVSIISITRLPKEMTYCLTEPTESTVVANGFVVGQCRHILAELRPGYGFISGKIEYLGRNHSEIAIQRGLVSGAI
jgi:hypothetical protein